MRGREIGPRVLGSAVARDGYRGPTREGKKKCTPATERRARKKRREKIISAGAKARERKKNFGGRGREKINFGREVKKCAGEKKKYYSGGSEKNSGVNETQPTKRPTYGREDFFLEIPIPHRTIYHTGRSCNVVFFLKVNAKDKK